LEDVQVPASHTSSPSMQALYHWGGRGDL
jgi:hypothetical protein